MGKDRAQMNPFELKVIKQLIADPSQSWRAVSRTLDTYNKKISNTVEKLQKQNILRPNYTFQDQELDREVLVTPFVLKPIPGEIGLVRTTCQISDISNTKSLKELNGLITSHPYLKYIVPTINNARGIFSVFELPKTELSKHEDWLQDNVSEDYSTFTNDYYSRNLSLTKWDPSSGTWEFPPAVYLKSRKQEIPSYFERALSEFQTSNIENPGKSGQIYSQNSVNTFNDELETMLIKELSHNLRLSPTELGKKYNLDKSTISTRIKKILEKHNDGQRLILNNNFFGVSHRLIFELELSSISLFEFINFFDQYVDFPTQVYYDNNKVLLDIQIPSLIIEDLVEFMLNLSSIMKLTLQNKKKSFYQPFNLSNYDLDNLEWRSLVIESSKIALQNA